MANKLKDKIAEIEGEHFGEIEQSRIEDFDNKFVIDAHEFRGGLRAVTSVARSLSSKMIEGLMIVEDRKYYLAWIDPATGETFKRFVDYLNSDEVPDLSKTKYYDLKALLLSEGSDAFDVFSGKKIPVATRKLLATKGVQISVEGEDLVIDDHRVPITDKAAMKELVETVHEVLKERDDREAKKDELIEKQATQIQIGTDEYQELQRNLNALRDGDPYDRALGAVIHSMLELTERIGHLPNDKVKAEKGKTAIETLWSVMLQVRKSYGVNFVFTEGQPVTGDDSRAIGAAAASGSNLANAVFADDDDLGDEEEKA